MGLVAWGRGSSNTEPAGAEVPACVHTGQRANVNAGVHIAPSCFYVFTWAAAGRFFGEDVPGAQDAIGHAGEREQGCFSVWSGRSAVSWQWWLMVLGILGSRFSSGASGFVLVNGKGFGKMFPGGEQ